MATSVCDLLVDVVEATRAVAPTQPAADGAVSALGHVARALERVTGYPSSGEATAQARRRAVIAELAAASRSAAAHWPAGSGRLVDLTATAADAVGRRAERLSSQERWAVGTELALTARRCVELATRFAPYYRVPELRRVLRLATLTEQMAQGDPPDARARAWLDTPIAARRFGSPQLKPAADVTEAVAALVISLEQGERRDTLTVYAVLAAGAAAECCAQHATTLATTLGGRPSDAGAWAQSRDSWRVLQAALIRFDDGSRHATAGPSQVTERAVVLQQVATSVARGESGHTVADAATAMRYVANQLPAIAGHIETSLSRWAESGRLLARARSLPRSEERVPELLRDRTVVVRPRDVGPVLLAARVAGRLSSALALELDRTAGRVGGRPQPHLVRALAEQARPLHTQRDARWADRLARRCAAPHASAAPTR